MLYVFLLSSVFVLTRAELFPPSELGLIESSRKCITSIAETYFVERPTVSVFTTNIFRDSYVLEGLYQSQKHDKKFFNFTEFTVNFRDVRKKYSVIVTQDLEDLIIPKQLDKLALWNARSKYIFYSFNNCENTLQKFMDAVWNYYIINAIVLMPSSDNSDVLNIFSWFPYTEENCGQDISPVLLDTCTFGTFQNNINLFPNKVPSNLHGCPVRIRVLIWPPFVLPPENGKIIDDVVLNITEGIEVQMTKAIASIANFTIEFSSSTVPHDWGLATVDGNVTGTIQVLREKIADIGMGSFGPTTERRMYCDHSVCHMQESLTWCVPKAQVAPRWKNLLQPFKLNAWLSMVVTYLAVSIIIWALCYCPPKDTSTYSNANNSLIYIFSAFLGLSVYETPNKVSSRISFTCWLFFGFHFMAAYQAKLIGVLLRPSYERQISTIEEVLISGMEYQILPTHKRFYANFDDWKVAKIVKDFTSCHDSDACLKRVASERNFALCTLKAHAEFEALQYRDSEGQPLIYCIDYLTFASELYMTKGYPLKDRIDKLIYRIRDSGLMFKWRKDLQRIWLYKFRHTLPEEEGHEQRLTIDHMQGAFGVLIIGLNIALLTFILETVCVQLLRRNLNVKSIQTKHF